MFGSRIEIAIRFEIAYHPSMINPRHRYSVTARAAAIAAVVAAAALASVHGPARASADIEASAQRGCTREYSPVCGVRGGMRRTYSNR
jgi:hypothetical protein